MSVTLRQLYETIKKQEEISLVAGESGLDQPVRWVHMVEGPQISSFLEGMEVAFTTGIALNSPEDLLKLVAMNEQKHASGMVINLGPYIKEIPEEVIAFGNDHNFPIFSVPWRVHMANIIREFTRQIHLDSLKEVELEVALKNALFLPDNVELYQPALRRHGYKKEWLYGIAVIEIENSKGQSLSSEHLKKLQSFSTNCFQTYNRYTIVTEIDESLILLFCNTTEQHIKEQIVDFLHKIKEHKLFSFDIFSAIGIGQCVNDVCNLNLCYEQAERAKNLQKKRRQNQAPLSYTEMGFYRLLFSVTPDLQQEYFTETLGSLVKYDHINETDYLYFLKKFFSLNCSVQDTAAKLHLHRNSVAYKLRKIEEIIGLNLNDSFARAKITIAFMIEEIL